MADDDFIMTIDQPGDEAVGDTAAADGAEPLGDEDDALKVSFALTDAAPRAAARARRGDDEEEAGDERARGGSAFVDLKLVRPLLKAVEAMGFEQPTKVQARTIPLILGGGDVCGTAVTGSGKTAAFMLPVLQRLLYRARRSAATAAVVLLPTRELAVQCHAMTSKLAQYTTIQTSVVVGGLSLKQQEAELRARPDLVIATPGRLIDLTRNSPAVTLESVEVLVLDEADRLLELGFRDELQEVVRLTPRSRQTLLFTATLSPAVEELIAMSCNRPATVKVDEDMGVATTLVQEFIRVHADGAGAEGGAAAAAAVGGGLEREAHLLSLCARTFTTGVLIFTRSRSQAHRLATILRLCELQAGELHGELTQLQRMEQLERFRTGATHFMVATDLAGRGLDIPNVQTVINFELPASLRTYVHRVGRTARAGRNGRAVSLVSGRDKPLLQDVVARAPSVVKTRIVPRASVEECSLRLHGLTAELRRVFAAEREDKELRIAEMEANKASNLLQHSAEIHARPARTWFLSEREKRERQRLARREQPTVAITASDGDGAAATGGARANGAAGGQKELEGRARDSQRQLTRKQRRKLDAQRELAEETGLDSTGIAKQQKLAARGHKALAKRNSTAAEQALRKQFSRAEARGGAAQGSRRPAAGGAGGKERAAPRAKPAAAIKKKSHSKSRQIKRRK